MRIKPLAIIVPILFVAIPVSAQELPAVGSYTDDARAARISELKVKYRISLSQEEKSRLISRCGIAKDNLRKLSDRVVVSTESRMTTYDSVIDTLASLRALVASRQIDASNIELLIVDYQRARTEFDIASTGYITALEDASILDCRLDPDGFRASIEGVREARVSTTESANSIDELTASNLKNAFDTLKLRLSAQEAIDGR